MVYSFITVLMTLTYLAVGPAYQASRQLARLPAAPVVVLGMGLVARELGLYLDRPCVAVSDASQLPASGAPYYLLARSADLAQATLPAGTLAPVAQGRWAPDKTGLLPHMLALARGRAGLEDMQLLQVMPARH